MHNLIFRFLLSGLLMAAVLPVFSQTQAVANAPGTANAPAFPLSRLRTLLAQPNDTIWVVDFWATYCRPCVESVPFLMELYPKYAGKPVQFVSVSLDQNPDLVSAFQTRFPMSWPQLNYPAMEGDGDLRGQYRFRSIPAMFVISSPGKADEVGHYWEVETLVDKALKKRGQ